MGNQCTRGHVRKVTPITCWGKFWSRSCCCCTGKADIQSQRPYLANGKVHLVNRIEKWEEKISEANRDGKILVANFSASWCAPCKKIEPVYRELADGYPSIIFVTVDVEELAEFSNEWDVDATPTIIFLKDGRQVDKVVGANKTELQKKTAAAADMLIRKS